MTATIGPINIKNHIPTSPCLHGVGVPEVQEVAVPSGFDVLSSARLDFGNLGFRL